MTITVDARAVTPGDGVEWLSHIPSAALVVARSMRQVPAAFHDGLEIERHFDDLLDAPVHAGLAERIAGDIIALATERGASEVVYLLGPTGAIGDATVEHLAPASNVLTSGGTIRAAGGPLVVVDALSLAEARAAAPFDAGLVAMDPSMTTVVTNWHGDGVTAAAREYLRMRTGLATLPALGADGCLVVPAAESMAASASIAGLRQIYARLRRPDGCPWDREQSEASTLDYIAEEVGELREAIEAEDWPHAADELGDILGNLVMIAQIAEEHGRFGLEDAIVALSDKLVRRHPHVFGDERAASPAEVLSIWNRVKGQEQDALNRGGSTTE